MVEGEEVRNIFSGFDKIDYRLLIQRQIERCIQAKGSQNFYNEVDKMRLMITTEFPGMDFITPIENEQGRLYDVYTAGLNDMKKDREIWYHPLKRSIQNDILQERYWNSLFEYMRDLLAKHRGLLWGTDNIVRGKQHYEE